MKTSLNISLLTILIWNSCAYSLPIAIDVDSAVRIDLGGGIYLDQWLIPDTGITQLQPSGSYSLDIEFLANQSYFVDPTPIPGEPFDQFITLLFGAPSTGVDPGLQLSSGTVEFTGVTGDFDATNPADLTSTLYIDNIRPGDEGVLVYINADLTNNGFSFHDVHFDFTLGAQGSNYNVGSEGVFLQVVGFNEVPEPATFALFCIGLAGLGWSRRKRA